MATATSSNMFVPEVHEDMAQAQFLGAVQVAQSAAVVENDRLVGEPGDTVKFPKWGVIPDLDVLTEGVAMTPVAMSTSLQTATIKEVGKAVEVTRRASMVALGSPLAEAARQFGILAARRVDADLITQAQADETAQGGSTPLTITLPTGTANTVLSWSNLVKAFALFGDEYDPSDFAGIYINSAQMVDLFNDANFLSADKVGATGTLLQRGQIGSIGTIPIKVSDRIAAKKVLLLKKGSLGLLYKQRPLVEQDHDILKRTDVIATTLHYACKRLNDRGVGVLTLSAS